MFAPLIRQATIVFVLAIAVGVAAGWYGKVLHEKFEDYDNHLKFLDQAVQQAIQMSRAKGGFQP